MATKINSYYTKAGVLGGAEAKAKLTALTSINLYQAGLIPDNDETIQLFEMAMQKIVIEFNKEKTALNNLRINVVKLLIDNRFI